MKSMCEEMKNFIAEEAMGFQEIGILMRQKSSILRSLDEDHITTTLSVENQWLEILFDRKINEIIVKTTAPITVNMPNMTKLYEAMDIKERFNRDLDYKLYPARYSII